MQRITDKDLQAVVDRINRITGAPETYSDKQPDGSFKSNIGNYCLDGAYGGVSLHRVRTTGGGCDLEHQMKTLFFVEITDTFGGEANYSWVTRHIIKAKSERGCANALSRRSGLNWHSVGFDRYDSKSGATCAFIREYDPEKDNDVLRFETDDRDTK